MKKKYKPKPKGDIVSLTGYLTKIFYSKDGWSVGSFTCRGKDTGIISVVGSLPPADSEELIDIIGEKVIHPNYGNQVSVTAYSRIIPTSTTGITKYLAQEIPGIGPHRAKKLADHFGNNLKSVLDNNPNRLSEIGIPAKTIKRISKTWNTQRITQQISMFLAQYDINSNWTPAVLEAFGGEAVDKLKANPYKLVLVSGIGFKRADAMAKKMNWPENSNERLEAVFTYLLEEATSSGHTHLPEDLLVSQALHEVEALPNDATAALNRVVDRNELVREEIPSNAGKVRLIYLPSLLQAELALADDLKSLAASPTRPDDGSSIDQRIKDVERKLDIKLSDEQRTAVKDAALHSLIVITGGPGTGKTTTLKALAMLCREAGLALELAAPTGRAAKRMSEVADQEAKTVHRLLEFKPDNYTFGKNKDNTLNCDVLAIDEASMMDLNLTRALLDAVDNNRTSVVFIGDSDQLPSVGPGNVLRDMIGSGKIKTIKLTKIFRQAEDSLIVRNAYRIVNGETPSFPPYNAGDEGDSQMIEIKSYNSGDILDAVKNAVMSDIPTRFGIPTDEIQVLVPMKVGPVGARVINANLQAARNPKGEKIGSCPFKVGDKVMQVVNNYTYDLFNGDLGKIESYDPEEKTFVVNFYGRQIEYPIEDAYQLTLAYASTIHKSQGSEYKAVVIVLVKGHFVMLNRNLLYTANTRAKKLVYYVGDRAAINIAVRNAEHGQRNSLLSWRLQH